MDNSQGVTQTPANSTQSQLEAMTRQINELRNQLAARDNMPQPSTVGKVGVNYDKYWFNSLQLVEVINPAWFRENGQGTPTTKEYEFMVEMRHFRIAPGGTEKFPGVIANVYLDGMSKILAQNDEKLSFMSDPLMRNIYYDMLIVHVEDLAPHFDPTPEYLRNVAPSAIGEAPSERPPWDSSLGERASDIAPNAPPVAPQVPEPPKAAPKPSTKEFEYEGSKFKMVVSKDGKEMFYKNGSLTSAAEYSKAASML